MPDNMTCMKKNSYYILLAVPGIPEIVLELGLIIMNKMNEVGSGI